MAINLDTGVLDVWSNDTHEGRQYKLPTRNFTHVWSKHADDTRQPRSKDYLKNSDVDMARNLDTEAPNVWSKDNHEGWQYKFLTEA